MFVCFFSRVCQRLQRYAAPRKKTLSLPEARIFMRGGVYILHLFTALLRVFFSYMRTSRQHSKFGSIFLASWFLRVLAHVLFFLAVHRARRRCTAWDKEPRLCGSSFDRSVVCRRQEKTSNLTLVIHKRACTRCRSPP